MYRFILFLVILSSCRSTKNQNSDQTKESAIYMGIVHLNENGCPYFIEISTCLVSNLSYYIGKNVYPIQLDEKFKKEGLKVEFNLTVSKAPSPADCQIDYVVSLDNVSVIKK